MNYEETKLRIIFLAIIFFGLFGLARNSQADVASDITNLCEGCWYDISGTHLSTLLDTLPAQWGANAESAVIDNWCGATVDTTRGRLLVFGGGHTGSSDNGIYAFDTNDWAWHLVSPRSVEANIPANNSASYYIDGLPASRHTYNTLQYVPYLDTFFSFTAPYTFYQSVPFKTVDAYNFTQGTWSGSGGKANYPGTYPFSITAYDSQTGHVWIVDSGGASSIYLWEYNPATDAWTQRSSDLSYYSGYDGFKGYYAAMAVDPVRQRLVLANYNGAPYYFNFDINPVHFDGSGHVQLTGTYAVVTTYSGTSDVVNSAYRTLAYDPVSTKMISWIGLSGHESDVYSLDVTTNTWAQVAASGSNTVTPTGPNAQGATYGRWAFIPSKNIFLVVNAYNQDVYAYRYASAVPDVVAPSAPSGLSVN